MQMAQAIESFLRFKEAGGRAPRTLERYEQNLFALALQVNNADLQAVTEDDLVAFLADIASRNRPSTVLTYYRSLRAFFTWCARRHGILDPTLHLDAPTVPQRLPDFLSDAELSALIAATHQTRNGEKNRAVLLTLIGTGARAGELCTVRRAHIDADAGEMRVFGKDKRERIVPLEAEVATAISTAWALYESDWAFPSERAGRQLTVSGLRSLVKRLARLAGLERRVYPHLFRHTFAHNWLRDGGDVATLMRVLGHTNLSTTQRYANTVIQDLRDVQQRIRPVGRLLD